MGASPHGSWLRAKRVCAADAAARADEPTARYCAAGHRMEGRRHEGGFAELRAVELKRLLCAADVDADGALEKADLVRCRSQPSPEP